MIDYALIAVIVTAIALVAYRIGWWQAQASTEPRGNPAQREGAEDAPQAPAVFSGESTDSDQAMLANLIASLQQNGIELVSYSVIPRAAIEEVLRDDTFDSLCSELSAQRETNEIIDRAKNGTIK